MSRFQIEVGAATDVGRQRKKNEDRHAVWLRGHGEDADLLGLLLVADGMGGERGGALASQTAVDRLTGWLTSHEVRTWPEYNGSHDVRDILRRALRDASGEVYKLGLADEKVHGLGSTAVLAAFAWDRVTVAHVGDSRCYLIRSGAIRRLTIDHTWVEEQVMAGFLTPEQGRIHPQRNVLTRSLGDSEVPEVDVRTEPVQNGDAFVLCSDGLTGGVTDAEILAQVRRHPAPSNAAQALVDLANEKDGSDNVTVVVAHCQDLEATRFGGPAHDPEDTQPMPRPSPSQLRRWRGAAVVAAVGLLTLLFAYLGLRTYAAWRFHRAAEHYQQAEYLHSRTELRKVLEISLDAESSEQLLDMIYDVVGTEVENQAEAPLGPGEEP